MSNYDFIKAGSKVFWHDPDGGLSDGVYQVVDVPEEIEEDSIILMVAYRSCPICCLFRQSFYTICGKFTFCICQISHSFIPIYSVHPHRFHLRQTRFPFLYGRAFILSWSFLLSPAIGFIRCKGRQSRLIRRLEVHFLQNSSFP